MIVFNSSAKRRVTVDIVEVHFGKRTAFVACSLKHRNTVMAPVSRLDSAFQSRTALLLFTAGGHTLLRPVMN